MNTLFMTEISQNWKKIILNLFGGIYMKREEIVNGNMANTMDELKILGKQMENLRDGGQLEEAERIADPQQFDDEEDEGK